MYFPANSGTEWETTSVSELGWNQNAVQPLKDFLVQKNTKSFMIPGEQTVYSGFLVPNAPADMFAAMGAKDQRIYVIPGKKMVIVRMGNAADPFNPNFAVSGFDNELWAKINAVIN